MIITFQAGYFYFIETVELFCMLSDSAKMRMFNFSYAMPKITISIKHNIYYLFER